MTNKKPTTMRSNREQWREIVYSKVRVRVRWKVLGKSITSLYPGRVVCVTKEKFADNILVQYMNYYLL